MADKVALLSGLLGVVITFGTAKLLQITELSHLIILLVYGLLMVVLIMVVVIMKLRGKW